MIESLPWQALTAAGGGWALAGVAVLGLISGRIVPRSTMQDVIHDRNEWRTESRIKDAQVAEKDEQLRHLAEVGRTVDAIMRAMKPSRRDEAT